MSKHGRINHGSCKRGRGSSAGPLTLEELVSVQGGKTGYGLDFPYDTEHSSLKNPLNTNQDKDIDVQAAQKVNQKRYRIFERKSSRIQSANKSDCDDFQRNPYKGKQRSNILSIENHQMKELRTGNNISHIVCSISENIARETCIASMEASSPVTLMISKQCNGQSYAETLAYLRYLQPDEILLNEGRKSSNLSQKVIAEFNFQKQPDAYIARRSMTRSTVDRHFGRPKKKNRPRKDNQDERTLKEEDEKHLQDLENHAAIKFVPRYFFDQKKGAELLHRVARQGSYDPSILEEYIFLSSSNAVIQYIQTSLGAYFSTASIDLSIHSGQGNRMAIDRSTIIHLELLANAKTGKLANSLIGTIDCTKTSVGSRLLRNNLISPPIRLATIHARLDLVDTFLQDEEFFYEVLAQLEALPDLNKMLSHISLTPEKIDKSTAKIVVTPRMASKGISALVCIKTTLGVVFNLARILEIQLTSLKSGTSSRDDLADTPDDCSSLSSVSRLFDNQNELSLQSCSRQSPDDVRGKDALIVGLGGSAPGQEDETFSINRHQLLEAIIIALKNPALNEIMSFVADVFTESTSYCKNSHAMRHQECFALKPNTDGIMDIIRKAYLSNVDDIYRFADEYAEAFGTTVAVKETAARGYFLSIPNDARPLPSIFMQPVKNGKNIHCTTEDVSLELH
jgi:DNA mismatch repair protein MSH4